MPRMRNERLDALLREAGWSRAQAASAFNRVAQENNFPNYASIGRSHISMWVGGTKPAGQAPVLLCQALSRRLRRIVTPDELGFEVPGTSVQTALDWHVDPLTMLVDLGEPTWTRSGGISWPAPCTPLRASPCRMRRGGGPWPRCRHHPPGSSAWDAGMSLPSGS